MSDTAEDAVGNDKGKGAMPGGDGLMDFATVTEERGAAPAEDEAGDAAGEADKAQGETDAPAEEKGELAVYRPEGLPDHLVGKDEKETIDKIAAAWKGARDQLAKSQGTKPPKDPDGYKIELAEDLAKEMDLESEESQQVLDAFRQAAHKANLTNAAFNAMIGETFAALDAAGLIAREQAYDPAGDLQALGGPERGQKRVDAMFNFGRQLVQEGIFNEQDFAEFKIAAGTAAGVQMIEKLRHRYGEIQIPVDDFATETEVTDAQIQQRYRDPRYESDPAFRKETEAMVRKKYPGQTRV